VTKKDKYDFHGEAFKKVMEACRKRNEIKTMDWCPDVDNPPKVHPLAEDGLCKITPKTTENSEK